MRAQLFRTKLLAAVLIASGLAPEQTLALSHSREYAFASPTGNLALNWSFENLDDFWNDLIYPSVNVDTRFKAQGTLAQGARSGAFVGRVSVSATRGAYEVLLSPSIPIKPDRDYTVSFYYQSATALPGGLRVDYAYSETNANSTVSLGPNYQAASSWTLYVASIRSPLKAYSLVLKLLAASSGTAGQALSIDDVVLEEGRFTAAEVASRRLQHSRQTRFTDGLGRSHQTHVQVESDKVRVDALGFNSKALPESTFLPLPITNATPQLQGYVPDVASQVNAAYTPANSRPDAKGYGFSEVDYAEEPSGRVKEKTSPGDPWKLGSGHTLTQGYFFANSLTPPADRNNPPLCDPCTYRVDWNRDKDGTLTYRFTHVNGLLMRMATRYVEGGTTKYSTSDLQYHPNGSLKRTLSPLGVQTANQTLSTVPQYNTLGQTAAQWDPDRGLTRFWYNRAGQMRFKQSERQRPLNEYTYFDYDTKGRLFSEGTVIHASLTQAMADQDQVAGASRVERIGYIHDDLSTFEQRTQQSSLEMSAYYPGRMLCKYSTNIDVPIAGLPVLSRLVSECRDFFDDRGRVRRIRKYNGAMAQSTQDQSDTRFVYDEAGRLDNVITQADGDDSSTVEQYFKYDHLNRVKLISDANGNRIAEFTYRSWGPLNQVYLGGSGTASGTRIDYEYHIQGYVNKITATQLGTNKVAFKQYLGFEDKVRADATVPALLAPRYGGSIAQQLYKFTEDVGNPVALVNYRYDDLGRMLLADGHRNTNADPLDASENINFTTLALAKDGVVSGSFAYNVEGQITGQRSGGVSAADSARYVYKANSHKLDNVAGKVAPSPARNMAAANTFQFDADGRMVRDVSKGLDVRYDWQGRPVKFTVGSAAEYEYYDADGRRAAKVAVTTGDKRVRASAYIIMSGGYAGEVRREYATDGSVSRTVELMSVGNGQGRKHRVNRLGGWTYEYHLRNHQGSVMRTVKSDGGFVNTDLHVTDFSAYGNPRQAKVGTGPKVREGFTGKEYDDFVRLTYYGARFWDPELALWVSPDAMAQYADPYGTSRNPATISDPDGNLEPMTSIAIAGFVLGAWLGGSSANGSVNPLDWDYDDRATYYGMAAGGIAGAGLVYSFGTAPGFATFGFALGYSTSAWQSEKLYSQRNVGHGIAGAIAFGSWSGLAEYASTAFALKTEAGYMFASGITGSYIGGSYYMLDQGKMPGDEFSFRQFEKEATWTGFLSSTLLGGAIGSALGLYTGPFSNLFLQTLYPEGQWGDTGKGGFHTCSLPGHIILKCDDGVFDRDPGKPWIPNAPDPPPKSDLLKKVLSESNPPPHP